MLYAVRWTYLCSSIHHLPRDNRVSHYIVNIQEDKFHQHKACNQDHMCYLFDRRYTSIKYTGKLLKNDKIIRENDLVNVTSYLDMCFHLRHFHSSTRHHRDKYFPHKFRSVSKQTAPECMLFGYALQIITQLGEILCL